MHRYIAWAGAAALAVSTSVVAAAAPVTAAPGDWAYAGTSGATAITALGTTISSGTTAASNLAGNSVPNSAQTAVAAVKVPNLASVGAITSGQLAEPSGDGVQITSSVEDAGINLLNGVITADAIRTTATASASSAGFDGTADTQFVRLNIAGAKVPLDIGPNTKITIPGIATVVLNESKVQKFFLGGTVLSTGAALHVTLLKARAGAPAGAEIVVNPVTALVDPATPTTASPVGGFAYGLSAAANVGSTVKTFIQPTGMITVPQSGTNGVPYSTNVAGVKITNVATVGVLTTSINATTIPGFADVTTGSEFAHVNLLNGIITADAINVSSHVRKAGAVNVCEGKANFVNLTIAGKKIPIDVKPNTLVNVLGIAKIWINQEICTPGSSTVSGLHIVLSTAKYGLPIGADVQVATANSSIG